MHTNILIFTIAIFLSSCTGNPAIEKSQKLSSQGKKIEAFDMLYAAYTKASGSDKSSLKQEMQKLSNGIAQTKLAKAQSMLDKKTNIVTINQAINFLSSSLKYEHLGKIKNKITEYTSQLNTLQDNQTSLLSDYSVALNNKNWADAYELFTRVKRNNPQFSDLKEKESDFITRRASYYDQEMQHLIAQHKWVKANQLLKQLKNEEPPAEQAWMKSFESEFQSNMASSVIKRAEYLISRHKYYEAYILLADIDIKGKKKLLFIIGRKGVNYYIQKAKEFMLNNAENPDISSGRAYVYAYKAIQLDKYNQEAFALHRDLQDRIIKKIKKYIAVSTFGSPSDNPGFGLRFSDSLISYLTKTLPFSIEIIEKSKVDYAIENYDSHEEGSQSLSQRFNVKLHITGNISTLSVERHRDNGKKTVFVTVGETQIVNPEYKEYFAAYGKNQSLWPRRVPPTITSTKTQQLSYNVGVEKINALMTASVRLFDTKLGAITKAEIFKTNFDKQDDFNDAVEIANISYNPLDLPSNNTIKEVMIEDLIKKIGQVVLASFKNLEDSFWLKADENVKRRENDKALQYLAEGMVFAQKNKLSKDNQTYQKIKNAALIELTD